MGTVKAQRCQPVWVRVRERLTEEWVQCLHPQPLSEARTAPAEPSLQPPPLLAAPSYPSGEGQAGRRRKQGRVLWDWESGEGFWSAVWSCWEGR